MDCNRCKNNNENYCKKMVDTYNSKYPHTGEIAHGGYSTGVRAHQQFVFKLPDGIEDKVRHLTLDMLEPSAKYKFLL